MTNRSRLFASICTAVLLTVMLISPLLAAAPGKAPARSGVAQETPALPKATEDWQRVQDAGKIVFGTAADYPPFEFYNSNFELDGFDIALAKEMGERLGLEVEFNDFAFDGLLDALRLGQVDAVIGAVSVTPDRQQIVDFGNLYYIGEDALLTRSSFTGTITSATDFADMKLGVERGTTYQSWVQQNMVDQGVIDQDDLVTYGTINQLLRDVRNGTVDGAVLGLLPAQAAARSFADLKVAAQGANKQKFAIAARKGSSLTDQLNEALVELQSDGALARLVEQYLRVDADEVAPPSPQPAQQTNPTPEVVATPPISETFPASCIIGMAYVADLNYDDQGMSAPPVMAPGQDFAKSWRVRNSGTCDWQPGFVLSYVSGNRAESGMGGAPAPVGVVVPPGATVDLTAYLRAPQVYGVFQGFWKMHDDVGRDFGEVVWVGIQVPDPNPPPSPPQPPPPPPPDNINPSLRADSNYINQGECTTIRWDVDNVRAVYFIDGGLMTGVGGHDARTVCPNSTQTYILRVVRQDDSMVDFSITIDVGSGNNAPYTINFWADSYTIDRSQCTALRWDVRNVREVYLNDEGVPGVSDREVCPASTQTWVLRVVRNDGGQETRDVTITVNDSQPERGGPDIDEFSVSSNSIPRGQCVRLRWRTGDTDSVNLYRSGTTLVAQGSTDGDYEDCPPEVGVYDYTLDANGNGVASQRLTVEVFGPQPR